ncbi:MAG: efflux RND transporter permease subunit [Campylobacterales bacterium]
MYKLAINRPIATLMFVLALVFFGIMSYNRMPASLFPDVEFPFVTIQTELPGADPASVESGVTDPIEEAVSTIEGVDQITSVSAEGVSFVFVQFVLERDTSEAANDVRDKVGGVMLPAGAERPKVSKVDVGATPVVNLFVSAKNAPIEELMRFADETLKPRLQRVSGVGSINITGMRDRVITVHADPLALARYRIDPAQLSALIGANNVRLGGGRLISEDKELILKTQGDAASVEELKNLIIQPGVRLSDVARVQMGLGEVRSFAAYKDQPGVMLEIQKVSGENTLSVVDGIKKAMPQLETLAGERFELTLLNDSSIFIRQSLSEVEFDMIYGAILAVVIVFFFLRNLTATLIAALSLPTSILGTFFLMNAMGFTLDKLTLLGLTLAIGVLIDDAIVVIENIYKQIEKGKERLHAAYDGVKEIVFSVVSIAAVLLAVFLPVAFMQGIVGRFFFSFALTVSFGVVISLIVALTLIPALSSRLLKSGESRFYHMTEPFFVAIDRAYLATLRWVIRFKWTTIGIVAAISMTAFSIAGQIGGEFIPMEDKGEIDVYLKSEIGVSVEEMTRRAKAVQDYLAANEYVEFTTVRVGYNTNRDAHKANIYVKLIPHGKRPFQGELMNRFRNELGERFPDLLITVLQVPDIKVGDGESPYMLLLSGDSLEELEQTAEKVKAMLRAKEGVVDVDSNYESGKPEVALYVRRESAARLGLTPEYIANAVLMAYSGEIPVGAYEEAGRQVDIVLRLGDEHRRDIGDLKALQITTPSGETVSLDGLVEIVERSAPNAINRFGRQRQITVTASTEGIPLGDAVAYTREEIAQALPAGVSYRLLGEAENMDDTANAFGLAMMLMFVIIFLILAALFESLIQPIIIMIALPLSFVGAFLALYLTGSTFNLFVMIGIMMLMGLVGKNSILLLDVVNQTRLAGATVDESLLAAGEKRLRPILMTTFAIIFGMLPLALGLGIGAEGKAPMGTTIIGGLLSSMFLTLLAVPAVYKVLSPIDLWLRKWYERQPI